MKSVTYYKGVVGDRTYIRASTRDGYQSIEDGRFGIAFSSKTGLNPAIQIDKAEYNFLLALKKARTDSNAPGQSWIENAAIVAPADEPVAKAAPKAARKPKAAKAPKAAAKPKAAPKAAEPAEKGPTVRERIWALMERPEGVSEPEVCEALGGWKRAGATVSRAVRNAPFPVRKERVEGKMRYFADRA